MEDRENALQDWISCDTSRLRTPHPLSDTVIRLAFAGLALGLGIVFLGRSSLSPPNGVGIVASLILVELGLYPLSRMAIEYFEERDLPPSDQPDQ